jgi:hypothetical protein
MTSKDDIQFHSDRAMAELDRALGASSAAAARAHFHLSALHLEKMRVLADGPALGAVHAH